jgi:hypothetical protein
MLKILCKVTIIALYKSLSPQIIFKNNRIILITKTIRCQIFSLSLYCDRPSSKNVTITKVEKKGSKKV